MISFSIKRRKRFAFSYLLIVLQQLCRWHAVNRRRHDESLQKPSTGRCLASDLYVCSKPVLAKSSSLRLSSYVENGKTACCFFSHRTLQLLDWVDVVLDENGHVSQ
jgi:hypothetical protein